MNKKGFTLVELLAVIVLLTLLGVFTISTLLEQTDSNKSLVDAASERLIKTAAQEYITLNNENFERKSGNVYCLYVEEILNATDVENINANTKNELSSTNAKVKVTFLKDNFEYDVTNDCVSNVDILPNTPNLRSNMIPIKWDKNNNIVKADVGKYGDWYDYKEKRWANVMIVSHDYLSDLKALKPGELIVPFNQAIEDAIFVVWIPKFKVNSYNPGSSKPFDISFEAGLTTTASTHPAFENTDGFWVTKFEVTRNSELGSTYSFNAYISNKQGLVDSINNMVDVTDYNFVRNEATISMISNYEWAAVAYLTNSEYGIDSGVNKEKLYPTDKITGVIKRYTVGMDFGSYKVIPLSKLSSTQVDDPYYTNDSVFASSNRNVTGIYGLSGGADEWVMDNISRLSASDNAAALNTTKGRLGSSEPGMDIADAVINGFCLARGGDTNNGGLFTYDFYSCGRNLSTRITIK